MVSHLLRMVRLISAMSLLIVLIAPASASYDGPNNQKPRFYPPLSDEITQFYADNEHTLLWFRNGLLTVQGQAVIAHIATAWTHGLNPDNYYGAALANFAAYDKRAADALISEAAYRFVNDLNGMEASAVYAGLPRRYWNKPVAADALLPGLAKTPKAASMFDPFLPSDPLYHRLRAVLTAMMTSPVLTPAPFSLQGTSLLRPGERHPAVVRLRERLSLASTHNNSAAGNLYDSALAAAVKDFQYSHGLKVDGIIGPATIAALNKTPQGYLEQVIVTMERIRRLPRKQTGRAFMVNIAAGTLEAYQDGQRVFEMPVITGRPKRKTQSFIVDIRGIRLNPDWTVPRTIKREDYWPILRHDPVRFLDKNLILYDGYGRDAPVLDPLMVNWEMASKTDIHHLRMVQPPGDDNALGRIRLLMPNRYDIFMHDTNQPALFANHERYYSSGCIRLARPAEAAHFVMQGTRGWSEQTMAETLRSLKTTDFTAAKPLKAYILYRTIREDADGGLIYGPDPYGWDAALIKAMKKQNLIPAGRERNLLVTHGTTTLSTPNKEPYAARFRWPDESLISEEGGNSNENHTPIISGSYVPISGSLRLNQE